MELHMTEKQFRRLLDLVYIGNWVLNSTRGDDRIKEYDQVESLVFAHCLDHGMAPLTELYLSLIHIYLCVANPPYFPPHTGRVAEGSRGTSRSETACTFDQLCAAAAYLLRSGGRFCLCLLYTSWLSSACWRRCSSCCRWA